MTAPARQPQLSIVIPALNEEEAIGSIIERTLAARPAIQAAAGIGAIQVIVVSDGSTDRTAEIARGYPDVTLHVFERNRGYGAAIKHGFAGAPGDLLGFLDADGTCDPLFFGELCRRLQGAKADVVIGSRLGPESEMPTVRRLGNRIFATIISLWGGTRITDSASGMRVVRRSSLPKLYPLPDGMHFTPAMSARAIFDPQLTIIEVPMRYAERVGESKLHPVRDGLRFLRIIVETAVTYRPLRLLGLVGLVFLALALGYGSYPVAYYLRHREIAEWMIYRLVAVAVALGAGVNLAAVGVLGQRMVKVIHGDLATPGGVGGWLYRVLLRYVARWGIVAVVAGVALNYRSLYQYMTTGHVTAHWVYVLTGGLLVTLGIEFVAFGVLARVLDILIERRRFLNTWADGPG